jgi:hypothetical protein
MPINSLYHTWLLQIRQLRPQQRITQVRNFTGLIVGIYESHSVHLSKIASKLSGKATLNSLTRRMDRLLENPAICPREWYRPIAQGLLQRQTGQEIRLIVDASKVGFNHQLLVVALAFRKRALPVAWTWVKGNRGHSSNAVQLALLAYVKGLLPPEANVLVLGDAEFGRVGILKQLDQWHWKYVLRQKGVFMARKNETNPWQHLSSLLHRVGQSLWLDDWQLTQKVAYPVNLLAFWEMGEKEPWLLATNLPTLCEALAAYRRRMWIEEMFGDLKDHGFDLESTHLRDFRKLSRLTLAVVLLYVCLVALGSRVIKQGNRRLVDRADRRDLSIFRIGWNMLERLLVNSLSVHIHLCPTFS